MKKEQNSNIDMSEICRKSNENLKLENIPNPDASWQDIIPFASSFNGYRMHGSRSACAKIANAQRDGTLTELRTCLFFEFRRYNHFGCDPDKEDMCYIREIIRKIRDKISSGDFE